MGEHRQTLKAWSARSEEHHTVRLDAVVASTARFLEQYATPFLVGSGFCALVGGGSGEERLRRLLAVAGYPNDAAGFFGAVFARLATLDGTHPADLQVGAVPLPQPLLMHWLTYVVPGQSFRSVRTLEELERLTNRRVPPRDRAPLQQVMDRFPVRLSSHTLRQMRLSPNIGQQYLPFVDELDPGGYDHTWVGRFHEGILERMYHNRCILVLNMGCPVYCRFCFRKHKECRNQPQPTLADVDRALARIAESPELTEIVLTGGDPFLNRPIFQAAVEGLARLPTVRVLRIATRSISYHPQFFTRADGYWLRYLQETHRRIRPDGKRVEVATHFIHPDEVSVEALSLIAKLTKGGIAVYVQTPFLADCNDDGEVLAELFGRLRAVGAEIHYVYLPCSPIHGNRVYWAPVARGMTAANRLRAHAPDRAMPKLTTATSIGKMDWLTSGWAVEPSDRPGHAWLRTPYTLDYVRSFAPDFELGDGLRVNADGAIEAQFLLELGDEALWWGSRSVAPEPPATAPPPPALQAARNTPKTWTAPALVPTGIAGLARVHHTRVEWTCASDDSTTPQALAWLAVRPAVSQVVLRAGTADDTEWEHIVGIARQCTDIDSVRAIRVAGGSFPAAPDSFSDARLEPLVQLNRLDPAAPMRVELETTFLHSSELTHTHAERVAWLRDRGITVYNDTPLLTGINDSGPAMLALAEAIRECGLEFHAVIVAGHPLQQWWPNQRPVAFDRVLAIATHVRRHASGRCVPRYLLRTAFGEVDFGIGCRVEGRTPDSLDLALLPYTLETFRAMDPTYEWPPGTRTTPDGHPIVTVPGLTATSGPLR